jgi:hypothetical protein
MPRPATASRPAGRPARRPGLPSFVSLMTINGCGIFSKDRHTLKYELAIELTICVCYLCCERLRKILPSCARIMQTPVDTCYRVCQLRAVVTTIITDHRLRCRFRWYERKPNKVLWHSLDKSIRAACCEAARGDFVSSFQANVTHVRASKFPVDAS